MKRYTDVDIIAELQKLVDSHVDSFKEDFDIDKRIIRRAAESQNPEDKTLMWFCRPHGTHCLNENQIFIQGTRDHNTFRFYAEQTYDECIARVIVPKDVKRGKVFGDVFEINYREQAANVARNSVEPDHDRLTFADGYVLDAPCRSSFDEAMALVGEHGGVVTYQTLPKDADALTEVLSMQKSRRDKLPEADKTEVLAPLLDENKIHLSSIMSLLQMLVFDKNCQKRIRQRKKTSPSYLFVDEFQDTDNTQIDILVMLCKLLESKLFVVGDVKQCIYRFRGATEEAFDQLPIKGNEEHWKEYALRRNYRTDTQLLNLFDRSFRLWGESDKHLLVYKPQRDQLLGTKMLNAGLPENQYYHQLHTQSDDGRMEALFDEVKRIQQWIATDIKNGIKLSDEDKTIAILVRENWQAEAIKAEGKRRGFQIHTHTGGDLYQTTAAIDMLALVNALLHFDEPEYLFSLLASNFFGVSVP